MSNFDLPVFLHRGPALDPGAARCFFQFVEFSFSRKLGLEIGVRGSSISNPDVDKLANASKAAASVAYIKKRLSDAQTSLAEAEGEIGRLIQLSRNC